MMLDQQTTNTKNEPEPQMRSVVVNAPEGAWYHKSKNRHLATLELSADNHIRLYSTDPLTGKINMLFDCMPQDVQNFTPGIDTALLELKDDRAFSLDFAKKAQEAVIAGRPLQSPNLWVRLFADPMEHRAMMFEECPDLTWWTRYFIDILKRV